MVIAFPILKNRSERKPKLPIVTGHFRNAIAASGHESRVVVSLLSSLDNRRNRRSRHSSSRQQSGQSLFKLTGELCTGQAEIDSLSQPGRRILNIQTRSERNPVEQSVGYCRLDIECRELRS
jgi:hypothetical protein